MTRESFDNNDIITTQHHMFLNVLSQYQNLVHETCSKNSKSYIDDYRKVPVTLSDIALRTAASTKQLQCGILGTGNMAPLGYGRDIASTAYNYLDRWRSIKTQLDTYDLSIDFSDNETREQAIEHVKQQKEALFNASFSELMDQTLPRIIIIAQLDYMYLSLKENTKKLAYKYPNSDVLIETQKLFAVIDHARDNFLAMPFQRSVDDDLAQIITAFEEAYQKSKTELEKPRGILLPPGEYNLMNVILDGFRILMRGLEALIGCIIFPALLPGIFLGSYLIDDAQLHCSRPETTKTGFGFRLFSEDIHRLKNYSTGSSLGNAENAPDAHDEEKPAQRRQSLFW